MTSVVSRRGVPAEAFFRDTKASQIVRQSRRRNAQEKMEAVLGRKYGRASALRAHDAGNYDADGNYDGGNHVVQIGRHQGEEHQGEETGHHHGTSSVLSGSSAGGGELFEFQADTVKVQQKTDDNLNSRADNVSSFRSGKHAASSFRSVKHARTSLRYNWSAQNDDKVLNVRLGYHTGMLTSGKDNVMAVSKSVLRFDSVPSGDKDFLQKQNHQHFRRMLQRDSANEKGSFSSASKDPDSSSFTSKAPDSSSFTSMEAASRNIQHPAKQNPWKTTQIQKKKEQVPFAGVKLSPNSRPHHIWRKREWYKTNLLHAKNNILTGDAYTHFIEEARFKIDSIPVWKLDDFLDQLLGFTTQADPIGSADSTLQIPSQILEHLIRRLVHNRDSLSPDSKMLLMGLQQDLERSAAGKMLNIADQITILEQRLERNEETLLSLTISKTAEIAKLHDDEIGSKSAIAGAIAAGGGTKAITATTPAVAMIAGGVNTEVKSGNNAKSIQNANAIQQDTQTLGEIDKNMVSIHQLETVCQQTKTELVIAKTAFATAKQEFEKERNHTYAALVHLIEDMSAKPVRLHDPSYLELLNRILHTAPTRSILDNLVLTKIRPAFLENLVSMKKKHFVGFYEENGSPQERKENLVQTAESEDILPLSRSQLSRTHSGTEDTLEDWKRLEQDRKRKAQIDRAIRETEDLRERKRMDEDRRKGGSTSKNVQKNAQNGGYKNGNALKKTLLSDDEVLAYVRFFLSAQLHDDSFWEVVGDFFVERPPSVRQAFLEIFTKKVPVWYHTSNHTSMASSIQEKMRHADEASSIQEKMRHADMRNAESERRNHSEEKTVLGSKESGNSTQSDLVTLRDNFAPVPHIESINKTKDWLKSSLPQQMIRQNRNLGPMKIRLQIMRDLSHQMQKGSISPQNLSAISPQNARRVLEAFGRAVVFPVKALPETESEAHRDLKHVRKRDYQDKLNLAMQRDALRPTGKYVIDDPGPQISRGIDSEQVYSANANVTEFGGNGRSVTAAIEEVYGASTQQAGAESKSDTLNPLSSVSSVASPTVAAVPATAPSVAGGVPHVATALPSVGSIATATANNNYYMSRRKEIFLQRVDSLEFRASILWTLDPESWRKHLCMLGPGKLTQLLCETSHDAAGFTPLLSQAKALKWKAIKMRCYERSVISGGTTHGRNVRRRGLQQVSDRHNNKVSANHRSNKHRCSDNSTSNISRDGNILAAMEIADFYADGGISEMEHVRNANGAHNNVKPALLSKKLCQLSIGDTVKDPLERHAEEMKAKNIHHNLEHAQTFVLCILEALNRPTVYERLTPEQACNCMSAIARLTMKGLIHVPDMSVVGTKNGPDAGRCNANALDVPNCATAGSGGIIVSSDETINNETIDEVSGESDSVESPTASSAAGSTAGSTATSRASSKMESKSGVCLSLLNKRSKNISKIDLLNFDSGDSVYEHLLKKKDENFDSGDLQNLVRQLQSKLITERNLMNISPKNAVQLLESIPILYPSDKELHKNIADFCAWMLPVATQNFRKPVPLKEISKIARVLPHLRVVSSTKHNLLQGLTKALSLSIRQAGRKAGQVGKILLSSGRSSRTITGSERMSNEKNLLSRPNTTDATTMDATNYDNTLGNGHILETNNSSNNSSNLVRLSENLDSSKVEHEVEHVAHADDNHYISNMEHHTLEKKVSEKRHDKHVRSIRHQKADDRKRLMQIEVGMLSQIAGDLLTGVKDRRKKLQLKRKLESEIEVVREKLNN